MTTPGLLVTHGLDVRLEMLGAYSAGLPPLYRRFGGYYLAIGGPGRGCEALGTSPPASGKVAVFGNLQAIRDFWWCEEYRSLVPLRAAGGRFDSFATEAVAATWPVPGPHIYVAYATRAEALELERVRGAGAAVLVDSTAFDRLEGDPPWQRIAVWSASPESRTAVDVASGDLARADLHVYRIQPAAAGEPSR